jgi:hypothetical protein
MRNRLVTFMGDVTRDAARRAFLVLLHAKL